MLAIVGPTGIGKSEVAVALARRIPAEIVSVDSMQVYRRMEIGTGKPSGAIRQEIPHHGLDLVDPGEEFDVAQYARQIRPVLEEIQARGRRPILVGGSGLYFRGLVDGICRAPAKDPLLREELLLEAQQRGPEELHRRLQTVDPVTAGKVHPNDLRRIVRGLEVFSVTGEPLSRWQRETTEGFGSPGMVILGLTCDRRKLYERIERRVNSWLASGWLEEAKELARAPLSRTAREALGYKELFAYLNGTRDWETTCSLIARNSRRYAKRQYSWFRQDARVRWIWVDEKSPEQAAEEILKA